MGLCASQARLLMLTARKSDLEFRRMQISNAKQMLAMQEEEISLKYSKALANTTLTISGTDANGNAVSNVPLNYKSLTSIMEDGKQKYVVNVIKVPGLSTNGKIEDTNSTADDGSVLTPDNTYGRGYYAENSGYSGVNKIINASPEEFQAMLDAGMIEIQMWNPDANNGAGAYEPISASSSADFDENYDTTDDARAEAEYNREMSQIKRKETALDLEAQQIETQHSAVSTEIESVQNLVKKNSESSFKYFS